MIGINCPFFLSATECLEPLQCKAAAFVQAGAAKQVCLVLERLEVGGRIQTVRALQSIKRPNYPCFNQASQDINTRDLNTLSWDLMPQEVESP